MRKLGLLVLLLSMVAILYACSSNYRTQGPVTDHYDGEVFSNQSADYQNKSLMDLLQWLVHRDKQGDWIYKTLPDGPTVPKSKIEEDISVTFVNHATVLIQVAGINLLTDPIWSERSSPLSWLGPKRYHQPGIEFADLPPIDAVLISHNHYDHMDLPTLVRLWEVHKPVFIVGLGNQVVLENQGIDNVVPLDWWQSHDISTEVSVHGVPAQHWSTRTRLDRNKSLWMGHVITTPEGPVYFAGDTGMGPHFSQIQEHFGAMTLSLLPIGAYMPRWFMKANHLSPADALVAHKELASQRSMAIHFGTFALADDGQTQAPDTLISLSHEQGLDATEFWVPDVGGQYTVSELSISH